MCFSPLHTILSFIFLAILAISYHPVLQFFPHLVYFLCIESCRSTMVNTAGPYMSLELSLWLIDIFSCQFQVSQLIFLELIWACSVWRFLYRTNISSCACLMLWKSASLVLVRFTIDSLSSIVSFASACSASSFITGLSILCTLFS